jgi:hypothetical protein
LAFYAHDGPLIKRRIERVDADLSEVSREMVEAAAMRQSLSRSSTIWMRSRCTTGVSIAAEQQLARSPSEALAAVSTMRWMHGIFHLRDDGLSYRSIAKGQSTRKYRFSQHLSKIPHAQVVASKWLDAIPGAALADFAVAPQQQHC